MFVSFFVDECLVWKKCQRPGDKQFGLGRFILFLQWGRGWVRNLLDKFPYDELVLAVGSWQELEIVG